MPSHVPPSFASAAAGQSNRDSRGNGRSDSRSGGDWPRKDGRGSNQLLTLRRSSTTPHGGSNTPGSSHDVNTMPAIEDQQSHASGQSQSSDNGVRYTKEALLEIYRNQQISGSDFDVSRLLYNGWDPSPTSANGGRGWGKTGEARDSTHGAEICWDQPGEVEPIALSEMTSLEKNIFSGDVNAPSKPTAQTTKDQSTASNHANGRQRQSSISHNSGGVGSFGLASPSTSRPGTRRQQTTDSPFSSLASPSASRFSRDEASPFFRRTGDAKDNHDEEPSSATKLNSPFGNLIRSNTAGSAVANGPSSPWGAAASNSSPMGNFGSFAIGSATREPATPSEKRPGFGSMRGESRLALLMPKESTEDTGSKTGESSKIQSGPWRSRQRNDTDPFSEDLPSGSAALGGAQDSQPRRAFGDSQSSADFSREHDTASSVGDSKSGIEGNDMGEDNAGEHAPRSHILGDIPEHVPNAFGNLPRAFTNTALDGSDRSQTSSVGANKGFPSLSGLGGLGGLGSLGGWPTSANPAGTPDRERNGFQGAFGTSLFSPMGDLQSPGLGGLGAFGVAGTGTVGRGSKLGSLFPAAMQAQMHGGEADNGDRAEDRQTGAFGAIGRGLFNKDTDSPLRPGRGVFDDMLPPSDSRAPFAAASDSQQGQSGTSGFAQNQPTAPNYQQSQSSDSASSLPQTQQRTMVMPDRMRWVYLDPQGQVQGPWSGLEMHDWYKASFFTADLSVKKVEDADFEPLGQLIRRIGNSREPFLVPQIGVPHGLPSTQAGAPFATTAAAPAQSGGTVQPPFAGAFPSFGTTLTAEQQNNLERRKQEEQYLMARQREFLAQQQVNMKQMQMQGGIPAALHHQGSAHSLQSQPSFGSITSPIGLPQGQLPGMSSFFDGGRPPLPSSGLSGMPNEFLREDDFARLNIQDRQGAFGAPQPPQNQQSAFGLAQGDRNDAARVAELQNPRLREFEQLRAQHDMEQSMLGSSGAAPIGPPQQRPHAQDQGHAERRQEGGQQVAEPDSQTLTLTEQVQKAASAKQSPSQQTESPWGKVNTGLPMPFPPPPQSTTPLPAPTAQRGRSDLAETLNFGTRSRSETPDLAVTTPSVAPWAKETNEGPKGPSLKEIQEAEAKKAAKLEEAALAARRAAAELELRNATAAVPPAPGLPTSATWAASGSPALPSTGSAWAKPTVTKAVTPALGAAAAAKKTLADIQKEEERVKQKIAAATAATAMPGQASSGKRYADLASKPTAPSPASNAGGAWSTVGASGKAKLPSGSAPTPVVTRSVSTTTMPAVVKPTKPSVLGRNMSASAQAGGVSIAQQEFHRWAKSSLQKGGLSDSINIEDFVNQLMVFPPDSTLIADSVYACSELIDGRRFAEEFLRRRKLAEKGVVESAGSSSGSGFMNAGESQSSGGWSEVAKKGPVVAKEEPAAGFKVVPNKKKGRK